jgi:hypothetical protein
VSTAIRSVGVTETTNEGGPIANTDREIYRVRTRSGGGVVMEPIVSVESYVVHAVPPEVPDDDRDLWTLHLQNRGDDRWSISWNRRTYGRSGTWTFPLQPPDPDDEFLAEYRFELDEALEIAKRLTPTLVVNGKTAQQWADTLRKNSDD